MSDALARARIEHDLDHTFLVEAAAGTGKTTALAGRIARLVASGRARITEIAAISFTERASGELVLKLRERLELVREASTDARERRRVDDALADFEAAYVGTIHGFCAELLRARPLEAGVDPGFVVLGDHEQTQLLGSVADTFLEQALAAPPEGVRRFLRRPREWTKGPQPTPREELVRIVRDLAEHRDTESALRRVPFDRDAEIDALLERLGAIAALTSESVPASDGVMQLATKLRARLSELEQREALRGRDHDELERVLSGMADERDLGWEKDGRGAKFGTRVRADVLGLRDAVRERLRAFAVAADADLAYCLGRDLRPALDAYDARKAHLGVLDHLDTLLRARALLAESATARAALSARFRYLFVDEVQDVDPVQRDVILLLAAADPSVSDPAKAAPRPGALFLVGDPKQAIYGFRRADLRTYLALAAQLVPAHAERLELSTTFRPRPAIAAAVNRTFAPIFTGGPLQAGHVPLAAARPESTAFPSVIALPMPRAHGYRGGITKGALDDALPDAIAAFVRWLLSESGLTVVDPDTEREEPVAPRHVALLFKTVRGVATPYARALERHGVPQSLLAPEAFFTREVTVATAMLLSAVEWPDDAHAVYATLRGPLLGLSDASLLAYRTAVGRLHPLDRPADVPPAHALVRSALALLGALHRDRHVRSIEATLGAFFERVQTEVALYVADEPAEARAVEQLRQLARAADARGATFRDFVRWMRERVEEPAAAVLEAAPDPEAPEAVTLLSVHKAKGLEFPVVILADATTRAAAWNGPDRYVDPARGLSVHRRGRFAPIELEENFDAALELERAEVMRLLYVAATRARDVLVVPTVGDGVYEEGWVAPLARALVPDAPQEAVAPHPGLPAFGARSVLDDVAAAGPSKDEVRPGHHAAHLDGHGVTFWDPQRLLAAPPPRDEKGRMHLVSEPAAGRGDGGRADAAAFELERTQAIEAAASGRTELSGAHRAARTPEGAMMVDLGLAVTTLDVGAAAASGKRFDALARRLFAVPLAERAGAAAFWTRMLGATDDEREAALAWLAAAEAHPSLTPALADPSLRFDVPFVLGSDSGRVVWGRAPRLWVREVGLVVIGVAATAPFEAARTELAIAATALGRARGQRSVEAWLLVAR
jgi:ATP-dependent exoDNAse (exonuclease V) beta subunit